MKLFLTVCLVVGASALRLEHLRAQTRMKTPASVEAIPKEYLEAGYGDESFLGWSEKQQESKSALYAPHSDVVPESFVQFFQVQFEKGKPGYQEAKYEAKHATAPAVYDDEDFFAKKDDVSLLETSVQMPSPEITTTFRTVEFLNNGYKFEPEYLDEQADGVSLLETAVEHPQLAGIPLRDFHKDHKFQIGFVPDHFVEAVYWDSPASDFYADAKAPLPDVLIETAPATHHKDPTKGDFTRDHHFKLDFTPSTYREALYWDSPASLFFEESEDTTPKGEDFKISPHGRTEDVNDPDYEINHPTDHKHTKNVIGTKQEGANFWTDTVQPPKGYESTYDQKIREANTEGVDEQAFSSVPDTDAGASTVDITCDDCTLQQSYGR